MRHEKENFVKNLARFFTVSAILLFSLTHKLSLVARICGIFRYLLYFSVGLAVSSKSARWSLRFSCRLFKTVFYCCAVFPYDIAKRIAPRHKPLDAECVGLIYAILVALMMCV